MVTLTVVVTLFSY